MYQKSIKLKISFIGFIMLGFGFIISFSGNAKAETWPNFINDTGDSFSISLVRDKTYHKSDRGTYIDFAGWVDGNTSANNTLSVSLLEQACDLPGGVRVKYNNTVYNCGNNPNVIVGNLARYYPSINKTKYLFNVSVINTDSESVGVRFKFKVNQNNVDFGYVSNSPLNFASDNSNPNHGINRLRIPIMDLDSVVSCEGGGLDQSVVNVRIKQYDPDNYDASNVQDVGAGNSYIPFKIGMKDGFLNLINSNGDRDYLPAGAGSWSRNGDMWYTNDSASSSRSELGYNLRRNTQYWFYAEDLGANNFISIKLPFDEFPTGANPTATGCETFCDNAQKIDSLVNSKYNDSADVDRQLYPASGGNPPAHFRHCFTSFNQANIQRYDADVINKSNPLVDAAPLCMSLPGGTDGAPPFNTACELYSFTALDINPALPPATKETQWPYNLGPQTYCEQVRYKGRISGVWQAAFSYGPRACITVNEWALSLISSATDTTVLKGQYAAFLHSVANTGAAPLDLPLDIDVVRGDGTLLDNQLMDQNRGFTGTYNAPDRIVNTNSAIKQCEYLRTKETRYNNGYPPPPDNRYYTSTQACVNVIDPTPTVTQQEYEKNLDGSFTFTINISYGECPTGTIAIPWSYDVPSIAGLSGNESVTVGNGSCPASVSKTVNITATQRDALNNLAPGTPVPYSVTVNGDTRTEDIIIIEVPFARFMGNDIYARSGAIVFNDSFNSDLNYDGRGSTAQYAAFAANTVGIDTAAYRRAYASGYPGFTTQPQSSLRSANSSLTNQVTSSRLIDEKILFYDDCLSTVPNTYVLDGQSVFWPSGSIKACYIHNSSMLRIGDELNASYFNLNYNNKISIKTTNNQNILIDTNINNTTANYTDSTNTGVMLIVSDGDIYIDAQVQRIDAILVARGNIYTCSQSFTVPIGPITNKADWDTACRTTLTINGSLAANRIFFMRTGGSRYLSKDTISPDYATNGYLAGIQNIGPRGVQPLASGTTDEIINYPAYLYYAKPYLKDTSSSEYNSLYNAPPRR